MNAYRAEGEDSNFEYHLSRVLAKFTKVISAEKAEILAGLLGSDEEESEDAA